MTARSKRHLTRHAVAAPGRSSRCTRRPLSTDLRTFARLRGRVPAGVVTVAESGVRDAGDVSRLVGEGADAVLVGETLMRAADPSRLLAELVTSAETAAAARGPL